jgi:hypothetical protein
MPGGLIPAPSRRGAASCYSYTLERTVGQLLREAALRAEKKTAGMAREILQWEKCLWTFVDVPGLEPTNNFGERCIRHAVMYRKTSFGTQCEEGSRFVERIFTATTPSSCRAVTCSPSSPTPSPRTAAACSGLRSYPPRPFLISPSPPELVNG